MLEQVDGVERELGGQHDGGSVAAADRPAQATVDPGGEVSSSATSGQAPAAERHLQEQDDAGNHRQGVEEQAGQGAAPLGILADQRGASGAFGRLTREHVLQGAVAAEDVAVEGCLGGGDVAGGNGVGHLVNAPPWRRRRGRRC